MSRDKQTEIEKIIDVLDKCTYDNELKDEMALMLYNAGYRKSTDVAKKIFAEIEVWLDGSRYSLAEMVWGIKHSIEELKKKHIKEITEEGKCQK